MPVMHKADIKFCCATTLDHGVIKLGSHYNQTPESIRKRKIIEHARDWPRWLSWPVRFCRYLGTHRKCYAKLRANTLVAPGVLFNDFAILVTPALALHIVFICRTSSFCPSTTRIFSCSPGHFCGFIFGSCLCILRGNIYLQVGNAIALIWIHKMKHL